jgi:hypothetical protein
MDLVLHAVRIKGIATPEAVAVATAIATEEVAERLTALAAEDLVVERQSRKRPGWVATAEGRERHAADLAAAHDADTLGALEDHYAGFLAVNSAVKGLAARWQAAPDDAARMTILDELDELHEQARPALAGAGGVAPRFGAYGDRLDAALEQLEDDPRYFVSPAVDSYHNVWFECHEDFLLTFGRTRAGEGSE